MSIRVIGGELRGRRLQVPDLPGLRPTTDRVRESIFNILAHRIDFTACSLLDLFAGSGLLGIEGLSRGGKTCLFVEQHRRAVTQLRENLRQLGLDERGHIIPGDVLRYVRSAAKRGERFDLIFADPPYRAPFLQDLPGLVAPLLSEDGLFMLERSKEIRIVAPPDLEVLVERTFGRTVIELYSKQLISESS